jgi:enoyl-CoA hydratase/carnithine racemase
MSLVRITDEPLSRGTARVVRLVDVERRNALSPSMLDELEQLIGALAAGDHDAVVLILAHEGPAFCSGTDLSALLSAVADEAALRAFLDRIVGLFSRIERLPLPTIAAIDGVAVGGGFELALACDFRILGTGSWVSLPEVSLGAVPGGGGAHRLHRFVGRGRALDLVLTGSRLDAAACADLGLCRLSETGTTTKHAVELAEQLCHNSSRAIAETKWLLLDSESRSPAEVDALAVESMIRALYSPDGRAGLAAVSERQPASFSEAPPPGTPGGG